MHIFKKLGKTLFKVGLSFKENVAILRIKKPTHVHQDEVGFCSY